MPAKTKFYAVRVGRNPGIYKTWAECQKETTGYGGAIFKSFESLDDAQAFINGNTCVSSSLNLAQIPCAIFVDGSYFNGKYSWGMAVYRFGELAYTQSGIGISEEAAAHHNIAGELEAVVNAVKWADASDIDKFTIFHDYIGISEWATGRWKTNTGLTSSYADFMKQYGQRVSFQKVTGHSGVEGNELADKLARKALERFNGNE